MKFNRDVPKWMDEFLTVFKKDDNGLDKTADINVEDLPKITWNDQIYFVLFDVDKKTNKPYAHIVNKYGNSVTTIPAATNLDEVDVALKSKTFISRAENDLEKTLDDSSDLEIFDEELKKAAAYINDEQPEVVVFNEEKVNPSNEDRFAFLEEKIISLTAQVDELVKAQEYARNNQLDMLDLNVQQVEQQRMEESMLQTEEQINTEHMTDLTTQTGRIQLTQELNTVLEELNGIQEDEGEKQELKELDDADAENFRNKVCPVCDCNSLIINNQDDIMADVLCQDCETLYQVDKELDKIYFK